MGQCDVSQLMKHEPWELSLDYAPTPGGYGSPYAAVSNMSSSPFGQREWYRALPNANSVAKAGYYWL